MTCPLLFYPLHNYSIRVRLRSISRAVSYHNMFTVVIVLHVILIVKKIPRKNNKIFRGHKYSYCLITYLLITESISVMEGTV